jgi:hypothetical protein
MGVCKVSVFLKTDTIKESHIQEFLNLYPALINRDALFYYKKCGAISILFHEFIKDKFPQQESKIIAGIGLNMRYKDKWMNVTIPEVAENIKKNKEFGHAVVLIDHTVYDLSSLQFTNKVYSIYSLIEFKRRWLNIDYLLFNKYDKVNFTNELKEIIKD